MLHAVASVFQAAGSKVSPPAQDSAAGTCVSLLEDPKSDVRSAAALALAAIANCLGVPLSSEEEAGGATEGGAEPAPQGEQACPEPLQALITATLLPNLANKSSSSSEAWVKRAGVAEALGAVVVACGAKVRP